MTKEHHQKYKMPRKLASKVLGALAQARENNEFVDFTFKFGEKTIGVHSVVLATQSNVFRAMFSGPMKENSPAEITDIPYDTFHDLICRMYGTETELESKEEAMNLYFAAHKYECKETERFARSYLIANLTEEDYFEVLNFAKLFDDEDLHMEILNFIRDSVGVALKSDESLSLIAPSGFNVIDEALEAAMEQDDYHVLVSNVLGVIQAMHNGIEEATRLITNQTPKLQMEFQNGYNSRYNSNYGTDKVWNSQPIAISGEDSHFYTSGRKMYVASEKLLKNFMVERGVDFYFKIVNETDPQGKLLGVHMSTLETKSSILAEIFRKAFQVQEVRGVTFNVFKKMIANMYGQEIYLSSAQEAIEFYQTLKNYGYTKGLEKVKLVLPLFINDETVGVIFKFIQTVNDTGLLHKCFEKYSNRLKKIVNRICKNDYTESKTWKDNYDIQICKQPEIVEAIELELKLLREPIANEQDPTEPFSMIKTLLAQLDTTIKGLSSKFSFTYTFDPAEKYNTKKLAQHNKKQFEFRKKKEMEKEKEKARKRKFKGSDEEADEECEEEEDEFFWERRCYNRCHCSQCDPKPIPPPKSDSDSSFDSLN